MFGEISLIWKGRLLQFISVEMLLVNY
jgi:hypothetical protein